MRRIVIALMVGLVCAAAPIRAEENCGMLRSDVSQLAREVSSLKERITEKDDAIRSLADEAQATTREVAALRTRLESLVAAPFLASPPPSSDTAGVAKHAVFAPRIEVDLSQRHDLVSLVLRRIEVQGTPSIASFELVADQDSVPVPIDRNGAVYVVEWLTSEGYTLSLVLRDGATGQAAATVQIRPQQRSGRFIFVGYMVE